MKTLLSTRLALAGTLALFTHTTLAQTWQTVDDFQYVADKNAQANAIAVDAQGNIYVAGMGYNGLVGYRVAIVRRSSDQGATWTTIEDYVNPNPTNHSVVYTAIGLDPAQNLYAVGMTGLGSQDSSRLIVRKSADGGATWGTALDVAIPYIVGGLANAGTPGFAADASGAIYVSVRLPGHSTILKSSDAGATWIAWNENGGVRGILGASAGLFTADSEEGAWGVVKKSLNGGATWTTVDSYSPPGFSGGNVEALCADWTGNLYVGGFANITVTTGKGRNAISTTTYNWVVRKGTNGGTRWTTLPIIPMDATLTGGWLYGLDADPAGNLYAVGRVTDILGYPRWIVEKGTNQGATWAMVEDFGPWHSGFAMAVACDAAGCVYVCGGAFFPSTSPSSHWIVRKQVGP
ncbi:MAG: exo-alpha-sialidase [Verrucomicrobia bacterium]|nr:exo-alpha-sialidase [Verrucomicrobiota bacterium]